MIDYINQDSKSKYVKQAIGENRHFLGQHANEQVQFFFRKHWMALVTPFAITLSMQIILIFILFTVNETSVFQISSNTWRDGFNIVVYIIFLYYFHKFFICLINWYLDIIVVTNYRIVDVQKTIFLQDDKDILDLDRIQDISHIKHGVLANILSYGDIVITLAASNESKVLRSVPSPDKLLDFIMKCRRRHIDKFHGHGVNPNPGDEQNINIKTNIKIREKSEDGTRA